MPCPKAPHYYGAQVQAHGSESLPVNQEHKNKKEHSLKTFDVIKLTS